MRLSLASVTVADRINNPGRDTMSFREVPMIGVTLTYSDGSTVRTMIFADGDNAWVWDEEFRRLLQIKEVKVG